MSYTPQLLINNKNDFPNESALSTKVNNDWQTLTWSDYYDFVIKISKSLVACGLNPETKAQSIVIIEKNGLVVIVLCK